MNIVTKSTLLLTATLVTGLISFQSHANMFGGSGQYVMMQSERHPAYIWVMDTKTGKVRVCDVHETKAPTCTSWSKD